MKQEALKYFPDINLTLIAMFIFLAIFTGITLLVMRKSMKAEYDRAAQLPLMKENGHE